MSGDSGDRRDDPLLRQLGQRARHHRDREGKESPVTPAELFAPWDAGAQAQLVAKLQAEVATAAAMSTASATATAPTPPLSAGPRASNVIPLRPRRRRGALVAAVGLLAAAGVALWFTGRAPPSLPAYALLVQGGDQALRSDSEPAAVNPATVPVVQPDSLLELRARPAAATAGIQAAAFARAPGAPRALPLGRAPEISPEGVVRWRGTARQLLGAARGEIEIVVVVGAAPLPALAEVLARAPGRHGSWQLLLSRVRVAAAGDQER